MVLYISTDHPRAQGPQGPPQVLGAARGHGDRPLVMSYLITIFQISGFTRIGVVFDRFVPLVPQVTDMGALLPTEGCSQVLDLEKKRIIFCPEKLPGT